MVNHQFFKNHFKYLEEKHNIHLNYIDQINQYGKVVILCSRIQGNIYSRYFLSVGMDFEKETIESYAQKNEPIDPELVEDLKIYSKKYFRQLLLITTFSA